MEHQVEITEGSPGKARQGPARGTCGTDGELTEKATEGRDPSTATLLAHGRARSPGGSGMGLRVGSGSELEGL